MNYKIKVFLFLMLSTFIFKIKAQTVPNKTFYLSASSGLARSEDGIRFIVKKSASQWTPMLNIGAGYRFNQFLGIEIHSATMLTTLKAEGVLVSNNEVAKVVTRHSNLVVSPTFYLPVGKQSEFFLRTGGGILLSNTKINSFSNPDFRKTTSNLGYMITVGYAQKVSNKLIVTAQFDFSDAYGSEDVWTGDLGLLNIGIKYSLNNL